MQPPDGDMFVLRGQFVVVEPPARLAYSFVWEDPDPDDVETLVELEFVECPLRSTEMRFRSGSIPDGRTLRGPPRRLDRRLREARAPDPARRDSRDGSDAGRSGFTHLGIEIRSPLHER